MTTNEATATKVATEATRGLNAKGLETKARPRFENYLSINHRLFIVAYLPTFVMSIVALWFLTLQANSQAEARRNEIGEFSSKHLSRSLRYGVFSGNHSEVKELIQEFTKHQDGVESIIVFDVDNRLIARADSASKVVGDATLKQFRRPIQQKIVFQDSVYEGLSSDADILSQSLSESEPSTIGWVSIYVSLDRVAESYRSSLITIAVAIALAAVIGLLLSVALSFLVKRPLNEFVKALKLVSEGRYDIGQKRRFFGEMGIVEGALHATAEKLRESQVELETRVAVRTKELDDALRKLEQSAQDRQALLTRSHEQIEDERRRFALELHDHLNSHAAAIMMQARHIHELARDKGDGQFITKEAQARIYKGADAIRCAAHSLYSSSRSYVNQLRPEGIDAVGLAGAIDDLVNQYNDADSECAYFADDLSALDCLDDDKHLDKHRITVFRVAQEALSNAAKHSGATLVKLLARNDVEAGVTDLVIQDNGRGFELTSTRKHSLGLTGMRERAQSMGGEIDISSAPSQGTTIRLRIPVNHPTAKAGGLRSKNFDSPG